MPGNNEIFLCAISNIVSGNCNEDCRFCTQSVKYGAAIDRYKAKPVETIVEEAKAARSRGAIGFCLVSAGKSLESKTLELVKAAVAVIKKEVEGLLVIACNGTAALEQLQELKAAGIDAYNHNLETSEAFYPSVCSTHDWRERYETCLRVKEAGLLLITGGIFGMGETEEDRTAMLKAIASLEPMSAPINFYMPNPALPLPQEVIDADTGLELVRKARRLLPVSTRVMIAGGRELVFGDRQPEIFDAGADAIIIGDYLTTSGEAPDKDHEMIRRAGRAIAETCPEH